MSAQSFLIKAIENNGKPMPIKLTKAVPIQVQSKSTTKGP
jgi:hypothetical protein